MVKDVDGPKAVRSIGGTVTKVDLGTGAEETKPMQWRVLPPSADCCQICGRKHEPAAPHDAQSIYYQTVFQSQTGRGATWADAMAHCDEWTKREWRRVITKEGYWTEPPEGESPIMHHGVE